MIQMWTFCILESFSFCTQHDNMTWCISCPGGGDVGKDSRCAGLTACCAVTLDFAALPGSTGVVWWMEGGQAFFVAPTDLAQDLQPLTGLYAVSCLHIERLLWVDHLKHLVQDKQNRFKAKARQALRCAIHYHIPAWDSLRFALKLDHFRERCVI